MFGPVGDRTPTDGSPRRGAARTKRATKVATAAVSRVAAIVHGIQARFALTAAVVVCILQEEPVKMGEEYTLNLTWTKKISDNAWRFRRCTARGTWPGRKPNCSGSFTGFESSAKWAGIACRTWTRPPLRSSTTRDGLNAARRSILSARKKQRAPPDHYRW